MSLAEGSFMIAKFARVVAAGAALMTLASPNFALAQGDDLNARLAAINTCQADPGYQGYSTEEICIDSLYQGYLLGGSVTTTPAPSYNGSSDPFGQDNCAASRIPERCH
jgi:hypothetical protein